MSETILRTFKHLLAHKYFPIFVLLCINLVVGALVITDYGESWDEHLRYRYAENSINAYLGIPGDIKDEKGPFFVMAATLGGNLVCSFREDCLISDARHYINFLSFLIGLFFLYRLNHRFTNKWAAFGGTLIFNTQPLLWGHAFMNPKDLPFMAFFIASIDTGFAMADSLRYPNHASKTGLASNSERSLWSQLTTEWKLIPSSKRRLLQIISIIILIIFVGLFISQSIVRNSIENIIQDIYTNNTHSFLATLFTRVAQNINIVPIESYVQKAWQLYLRAIKYLSLSLVIIWMFATIMNLPETRNILWNGKIRPTFKAIWKNIKNPKVIVAGVFLGLTCSIRTLGPAAGGLIGLYIFAKHKRSSFSLLMAYCLVGAIVTYTTWPGLWDSPIKNFLESLSIASEFPWDGKVLFDGILYNIGTHPRSYMPVLLSIQFTFTALIAIIFGLILSIAGIINGKLNWAKVTILYLWFFTPFAFIMFAEPKIYDNFRHFLFIIPPLFTFAAIGLQSIFNQIKRPVFQAMVIFLLVLPNLFSLIKLHPYQYVYYNFLTDGVAGAFRKYEMDYWGTSYREATEYINQIAPQNAKIIVFGAPHLVETYAREDLEIEKYSKEIELNRDSPTFAILLSRYDKDTLIFPDAENIFLIERDGAIFAVIKDLTNINLSAP